MDKVPIFLNELSHEDSLSSLFFLRFKEFFVMLLFVKNGVDLSYLEECTCTC